MTGSTPGDPIEGLVEGARRVVRDESEVVGPTVLAGALAIQTARYLKRQADVTQHAELAEAAATLHRVGRILLEWRPEGL